MNILDPPYEPPFELPDYKELGRAILQLAGSRPFDDVPQYKEEFELDEAEMAKFFAFERLPLPELGLSAT